jgi:alkylmercury lyase
MPDLEQIFAPLAAADLQLDETQQVVSLALYRELAKGTPVSLAQLALALESKASEVSEVLNSDALSCLTFHDEQKAIIGFGGLAVVEMAHKFIVNDQTLYTWCAWDSLFIPELLGTTAQVESTCPETKSPVQLRVAPDSVKAVEPKDTVMSFLLPDALRIEQTAPETMKSFCHKVSFLVSSEAGRTWTERHAGTFVLSLEDAFTLAQMLNTHRFGPVLRQVSGLE